MSDRITMDMRILMVHDTLTATGGAERYIRAVTSALIERGFRVAFLGGQGQRPAWIQAPVYSLSPSMGVRSGRRSIAELKRILSAFRPDVIYLHNLKDLRGPEVRSRLLLPMLLRMLVSSAASVWFVHDIRPICPNETKIIRATGNRCAHPVGAACVRAGCCRTGEESPAKSWTMAGIAFWLLRICRCMSRIIAPSQYVAEELRRNGIPAERTVVLPHFTDRAIDGQQFRPDNELLWVGRFDRARTKGFEAFADLLGALRDLPWRAAVVGDGPLLPEARALTDREGLAPRVTFLGCLTDADLDRWYARSRLVVVTSMVAESFCMVGIEAMAHGRPVVTFDVGGMREWLEDGVTGYVVPPGDGRAMAAAVRRLLTEPGLANRLGEAGRSSVDARFRPARHLEDLVAILGDARDGWAAEHGDPERRRLFRATSTIP